MEKEVLYQSAQLKINEITAALTSLTEFSFAKDLCDIHTDIENHFDVLFKALQKRKEELIGTVDKLSQELQKQIEGKKKDLTEKIEATNLMIECGVKFYNFQRDLALGMWKNVGEVTHAKTENKRVRVDFPSLLESINSHGTVRTESTSVKPEVVDPYVETIINSLETVLTESTILNPKVLKPTVVGTVAGSSDGNVDGQGVVAKFSYPHGIVFNPLDNCLYVCDYGNDMIRKVTKSGNVSKFAKCSSPIDIAFYQKDQCYFVAESIYHSIIRVSLEGKVSPYAGLGIKGYQNGYRMSSLFNCPYRLAVNQDTGDLYVSDYGNHVIRKISIQGRVSTLAGTPLEHGYLDGIQSLFYFPRGICFHSQQKALIVCDWNNNMLRKVTLDGAVTSICKISQPRWAIVLSDGAILVTSGDNQIIKISFNGNNRTETEVFAGSGRKGHKDGIPHESTFNGPFGIAIDEKTKACFVVDNGNNRIRVIY